jgi:hypothetical protein
MDRQISSIIRKLSILLGLYQEKCGSGLAIQNLGFSSLLHSLGLRHGGGSSVAGSRVPATVRVGSANWRLAAARHVSGDIES